MDISGTKVLLKDGTVTDIISHNGNHLKIIVTGKEKTFDFETVFKNGYFVAINPEIQKAIMNVVSESAKLKEEEKKIEYDEERTVVKPSQNLSCKYKVAVGNQLKSMNVYGTKAQDIYDECCIQLAFKSYYRGLFGMLKKLYALNATKEGYSVWFLAHSNWTATSNGKWSNEIHHGIKYIDEFWDNNTIGKLNEDAEIRVTFAKKKNYYVFLGIYKCLYIDNQKRVKRYKIISDKYPL